MARTRRWKLLVLLGAVSATLAVILWATFIFTAVWLRGRCARQLAEWAEPLEVVNVLDEAGNEIGKTTKSATAEHSLEVIYAGGGWESPSVPWNQPGVEPLIERLESLQHPSLRAIWQTLSCRNEAGTPYSISNTITLAMSPAPSTSSGWNANSSTSIQVVDTPTGHDQDPSSTNTQALLGDVNPPIDWPSSTAALHAYGRAITWIWDPFHIIRCVAMTDTAGEQLWVVIKPIVQSSDETGETSASPKPQELLLIDSSGRILSRLHSPADVLLGKLSTPLGKADQLVFATPLYEQYDHVPLGSYPPHPATVCVIENGDLKIVRRGMIPVLPVGGAAQPQGSKSDE